MQITNSTTGLLSKAILGLKHHAPTILSCLAGVGVIGTTVMAVKATPKAYENIKEESRTNHDGDPNAYTKIEAVKAAWKYYIPSAVLGAASISCIFGANVLNRRSQATLAGAYAMLSQSYQRYRKAANEVFGIDADSKIKAQMANDVYVHSDGVAIYSSDLDPDGEKILFFDSISEKYFNTTMAAVINAEYHVNRNLELRGDVYIDEFHDFLGIDRMETGKIIGWSMDDIMESGLMWLDFDNHKTILDGGIECVIISPMVDPIIINPYEE